MQYSYIIILGNVVENEESLCEKFPWLVNGIADYVSQNDYRVHLPILQSEVEELYPGVSVRKNGEAGILKIADRKKFFENKMRKLKKNLEVLAETIALGEGLNPVKQWENMGEDWYNLQCEYNDSYGIRVEYKGMLLTIDEFAYMADDTIDYSISQIMTYHW